MIQEVKTGRRLPHWMKAKFPAGEGYSQVKNLLIQHKLNTICTSGNCPNKGECWGDRTASFMILGDTCTRNCRFCNVRNAIPLPPDDDEPLRLAQTIQTLGLKHVVVTSVDRDDLPDGGALFWANTIRTVKEINPDLTIETLIPDFNGHGHLLDLVISEKPDVISHNLETVERVTPLVRNMAIYRRSLGVLEYIASKGITAKTGIMLGLGETRDEVLQTMADARATGCMVFTIGQYLQPSAHHFTIKEFIEPAVFDFYRTEGLKMGFAFVESSPLVRSSYHASRHVMVKSQHSSAVIAT